MEKQIELKIKSDIKSFGEIENFIMELYKKEGFSRKTFCRMYLSVSEAVNNAIKHGNKLDPSKYVDITFVDTINSYLFQIKDQGLGFDYESIPDPTLEENIKKESGRGIYIMEKYADMIDFENNGSTVKLIFKK